MLNISHFLSSIGYLELGNTFKTFLTETFAKIQKSLTHVFILFQFIHCCAIIVLITFGSF